MKLFNIAAFDDNIAGTTTTWYSPATLNGDIGTADMLILQANASNVTGTAPVGLTVRVEHSADGQNWVSVSSGSPEINATDITPGTGTPVNYGYVSGVATVLLSLVRLRIALTGANPQCRLKVLVTGRSVL